MQIWNQKKILSLPSNYLVCISITSSDITKLCHSNYRREIEAMPEAVALGIASGCQPREGCPLPGLDFLK